MDYLSESIITAPLNPKLCLSKQIEDRIIQVWERLVPGTELRLPASRDLAQVYKTCHVTVHGAYRSLMEKGIIVVKGSQGTYLVAVPGEGMPKVNPFATFHEETSGYRRLGGFLPANLDVAVLEMYTEVNLGKISDNMHSAVYSRARSKLAGRCSQKSLSEQILKKLHATGLHAELENVFVPGRGTALKAVATAMLIRDDVVVMESVQDVGPYVIFRSLGCQVAVTGTEEGQGMNMFALQEICRNRRVRLVFIRPDSSWPFGMVTGDKSRDRLVELSKEYNFKIIAYEYETEYTTVSLPPRLSVKPHEGRVIYVSVISRVSRLWEQVGFVVGEPELIDVLKDNDALLDGPRCRSFDQIAVIMHENGSLSTVANKLIRGHRTGLKAIANMLRAKLSDKATVIKPACGRFIVIQFHKPVHVKHLASLSVHQNLNYHERNKHLKADQTVSCLRIEYTIFEKAEWEQLAKKLTEIISL